MIAVIDTSKSNSFVFEKFENYYPCIYLYTCRVTYMETPKCVLGLVCTSTISKLYFTLLREEVKFKLT